MDIKAKAEELIEKIKSDKDIADDFRKDPIATVERLLGVDLPNDQIEKIVELVKAKIDLDKLGGLLGKLGGKLGL